MSNLPKEIPLNSHELYYNNGYYCFKEFYTNKNGGKSYRSLKTYARLDYAVELLVMEGESEELVRKTYDNLYKLSCVRGEHPKWLE